MSKKKKATAKKIKVVKVTTLEPDKHLVELEVEGAPIPVPTEPYPVVPIALDAPAAEPENSWLKWLKGLW